MKLKLGKTAADYAEGLPDKTDYGDIGLLNNLPPATLLKYVLQKHMARRAGPHFDMRMGTPETGLYSWAIPKAELPEPGKRKLAVRTQLHRYSYAQFEGTLKGYGAGTVEKADEGEVLITKAQPDQINFVVAHHRVPETYTLKQTNGKNWLLINTTPQQSDAVNAHEKIPYTKVDADKAEQLVAGGEHAVSEKLDGAMNLFTLLKDKIEATSYRKSAVGGQPIIHTYRIGQLTDLDIPKEWQGTILKGEVIGEKAGKVIPSQTLGGLLNASVSNSLKSQARTGTELKGAVFDVLKGPGGSDVSPDYGKRLETLKAALAVLPQNKFIMPQTTTNPDEARQMIADTKAGLNPRTKEGVVLTPLQGGGKPAKLKFKQEANVYIRNIFPAETQDGYYSRAGGFDYSNDPEGPVVGRVGSGLDRQTATDMLNDPKRYVGRKARIEALDQFPSGAYRAPVMRPMMEQEDLQHSEV